MRVKRIPKIIAFYFRQICGARSPLLLDIRQVIAARLPHWENLMTKLFAAIGVASVLILVAKYGLVAG